MEITLNDISRRIKEIADERGYTPYALAEKVPQVVQSTVYNALSGTKSMKVETLLYICEALGISPKDFFDFDGEVEYHLSDDEKVVVDIMRSGGDKVSQAWKTWQSKDHRLNYKPVFHLEISLPNTFLYLE